MIIINGGAKPEAYRLGWRHYRMDEDGNITEVHEEDFGDDIKPVVDMVRFAPRRIAIPPGATQQVRLMLRRPSKLPDGEYRSHFWVKPESIPTPFESAQVSKGASVEMKVMVGMTVPVIVRQGNLTADVRISDAKLVHNKDRMKLDFTAHRTGERSVYGDFEFVCTSGGRDLIASMSRGSAIYSEISKRHMSFNIKYPQAGAAACKTMRIIYSADKADMQFKGAVMAEATVSASN
jgi:hypothetical protein